MKKCLSLALALLMLFTAGIAMGEETREDFLSGWNPEDPALQELKDYLLSSFDIQYVLYLGTNDKDTNEPVYTPEESLKILEEILLRHFGGYTIQEARGGWVDNETEYQEYTLVIYLSDTNLDAVRAAADEMIETFRQRSVLIQANPTRTEFYSAD